MAGKKRWYVEVKNAHTNEVVARELPAENAQKGVLCQDGEKRDLWMCDYKFITKILENEQELQLKFLVLYREGRYGPVKPWPFLRKKRLPKGAVTKGGKPVEIPA